MFETGKITYGLPTINQRNGAMGAGNGQGTTERIEEETLICFQVGCFVKFIFLPL
jgi:hypothetical protein